MKRWTPKAIALLKEQSHQSRQGLPVTLGNGLSCQPAADPLADLLGQLISQRQRRTILRRLLQGKPITFTFHRGTEDHSG